MKKLFLSAILLASLTIGVLPVNALQSGGILKPRSNHPSPIYVSKVLDPAFLSLPVYRSVTEIPPVLDVYIRAPEGFLETPYVILSGVQSSSNLSQDILIKGLLGSKEFTCNESPCALEVLESSQIVFHAENTNGDFSTSLTADIVVRKSDNGYQVVISKLGKFTLFSDRCGALWKNTPTVDAPSWSKFPQDPSELNTKKDLFYLSSQLMNHGIVDTSSCPNGGWLGSGPNDCALELIRPQMEAWQNQFDLSIWNSGRDKGIPPIVLKSLIEVESQFWPITQRLFLDEIGLAQINQLGIDVLLRTDAEFYQKTCSTALMKCDIPYSHQTGINQQILRGSIAASLDASCPTCVNGISLDKASNSIPLISKVLYGNCTQTNNLLNAYGLKANYEDAWKITMVSYHSGVGCLQGAFDAFDEKYPDRKEITWENVSNGLACPGAVPYVDKIFTSLVTFDQFRKTEYDLKLYQTSDDIKSETASFTSTAKVTVRIFIDKNNDGQQQPDEAVNDIKVDMLLSNGEIISKYSENGQVTFDLTGKTTGLTAKFTLPGLYRSATIIIPASGDVPVTFVFIAPVNQNPVP